MHRPLRIAVATALAVATFAGASAANAAPVSTPSSSTSSSFSTLTRSAAQAREAASASLGGIALPASTAKAFRAATVSKAPHVERVDLAIRASVAKKRYDIHVVSVGSNADPTRIDLSAGAFSTHVAVKRLVRVTVQRHGAHTALLVTTTTFKRFVVMLHGLLADPLLGTQTRFANRSDLISALAHGLAIDAPQVREEYGAVLRFAQMGVDLSMTLLQATEYLAANPSATDFSGAPVVHTTTGSGGYAGSVTISGDPSAYTATAVNTTDDSTLSEAFTGSSITLTYTVDGKTWSHTLG